MNYADKPGFNIIRNATQMDFSAALFATTASGFATISALAFPKPTGVAVFFDVLAIFMQCIQHMTRLFDVTRSVGVTRKLFLKEQFCVNRKAYMVAALIESITLFWMIIPLGFFGATANVLLGNIMGDP